MQQRLILAAAAALALSAAGCATPPADKSAGGASAQTAASGAGNEKAKRKQPWWRLSRYSRPGYKPVWPGDMPPGSPGLLSGKDGEFVLYRKGEAGVSSDPTKPTKVRR